MARPLKENLDWFQHDCRASSDEKLEILETKYPNGLGYAWYFKCLERVYYHQGKLDVSEAETRQILCRNLSIIPEEIIEYSIKIGLFDKEEYVNNKILTSKRIQRNVKPVIFKREQMAIKHKKRVSEAETPPEIPPETGSTVEYSTVEYIKEKPTPAPIDAEDLFCKFWKLYPKKRDKGHALKAWSKIKKPVEVLEKIKTALEWQTVSPEWKKEGGQFVPMPASYLNGLRWEDENKNSEQVELDFRRRMQ